MAYPVFSPDGRVSTVMVRPDAPTRDILSAMGASIPGKAVSLAALLRQRAPSATPNRRIVEIADRLLGRDGRMVAAIDAIGRGADAFEGTPFALEIEAAP